MKPEHIPFFEIETKWQARWAKDGVFKAPQPPRPGKKFYCLDMFPYPSAAGLHVGHPEGYTATDILCRAKRMQGWDVLHPMGWDAFGLPTENFALQTGTHPRVVTENNIANFKRQIQSLGFSYDWDREINTTDPAYYRWTQWIFLQLFKKGLAYESTAPINWCPSCKTGLANEEVFGGACERCGTTVERKSMRQWILRITAYADRLEKDLDELDWPASTLAMQRHWIGRSDGAEIKFKLENGRRLAVFTTRPDTIYGATYMVLAPEHELVPELTTAEHKAEVEAYRKQAQAKSDMERTELQKEKTGVFTGSYAINPLNNKKIPIWLADYVLAGYGTGAIMAVPAHDERDWAFAHKFKLPVFPVVKALKGAADPNQAFCADGEAVNSPLLAGMPTAQAKQKIIRYLEENGLGKGTVRYKLRDWIFSRQRYWGEPIPIIHCPKCGQVPVPEKDLPVLLPEVTDYRPSGTGESPLANAPDWVNTKCPGCGGAGKRETNTMPQWAGSCWYYLRYTDPKNTVFAWSIDQAKTWGPVDCYVGGAEHAVLHLLYARFWHKALYDLGFVSTIEPFQKLRHQGMILSYAYRDSQGVYHGYEDVKYDDAGGAVLDSGEKLQSIVEKMSKSKKNAVNPDAVLKNYGADAFRLYEMFMGPFEQAKPWDMRNIKGVSGFLRKVWALALDNKLGAGEGLINRRHRTIKKVTGDIESFGLNTAVSEMMIYLNDIQDQPEKARVDIETLLTLLHPFAPHVTEELWERLGHKDSMSRQPWPAYQEKYLQENKVEYAVQVNGKVRATFEFEANAPEQTVTSTALGLEKIKSATEGKSVVKTIVVPNRLVNIVVK
ncbi:MAG: leucine--tRNA ligase [Elusimicrobia bacterium RIFCSPHIGHO2_02_FULL_57_9]|nr:MAG: leucine--tRNA ligase [Elusimicrobia bacterium RIFCSPHIGHO2_02_FULL_57_9]